MRVDTIAPDILASSSINRAVDVARRQSAACRWQTLNSTLYKMKGIVSSTE